MVDNIQDIKINEVRAKTLLRKSKKIDSWFLSCSGMNIYRGCQHACVYCDGRTEKYQVKGEFGSAVTVKINASHLLAGELDNWTDSSHFSPGFIFVGGGVGDSYQQIEKEYKLTRKILNIIKEYNLPIHILTKSPLILRDLDLIKEIHEKSRAIVSMSFSSVDDRISKLLEPGVASPSERLDTLEKFKNKNIPCGMYLMPTIPYITDTPRLIEKAFQSAQRRGFNFLVYAGLTLKKGRQKQFFYDFLNKNFPEVIDCYDDIYQDNKWGAPIDEYKKSYGQYLLSLSRKYKIPIRLPISLVSDIITPKDQVVTTLEQIDYLRKMKGQKSGFGYTAYNISRLEEDIYQLRYCLQSIKGVGPVTERIILDILKNGSSEYYEKLLHGI